MAPTLEHGGWLCVDVGSDSLPNPGQLVVVRDPTEPGRILVKRVRSRGDATFAVASDDPCSGRDSRHFGSLAREQRVRRVLYPR